MIYGSGSQPLLGHEPFLRYEAKDYLRKTTFVFDYYLIGVKKKLVLK